MVHAGGQLLDFGPDEPGNFVEWSPAPLQVWQKYPREDRVRIRVLRPQLIQRKLPSPGREQHKTAFCGGHMRQAARTANAAYISKGERVISAGIQDQHTNTSFSEHGHDPIDGEAFAYYDVLLARAGVGNISGQKVVPALDLDPVPGKIKDKLVARLDPLGQ